MVYNVEITVWKTKHQLIHWFYIRVEIQNTDGLNSPLNLTHERQNQNRLVKIKQLCVILGVYNSIYLFEKQPKDPKATNTVVEHKH